nr:pyridoxal-dependent decarboxylase [Kofleriaceae bacterium]
MSESRKAIADAFDAERFRADGHRLIDALADQLAAWHRGDGPALPWSDALDEPWRLDDAPVAGTGELVADLARVAAASTALAHPRTFAHQVAPPLPGAALAELVGALINNGMAVYEMGPAATPIELEVVAWLCRKLGLPVGAGGVLTSGGSLGNLTALLAMRQARAGFDAWRDGTTKPLAVITSSDSHYSISRATHIMGWGDRGAIAAPVDARHHLTAVAVRRALDDARDVSVIGVVAAAGSTATGAFDPLDELADLCAERDLWLHVDAAHGGSAALSATHASRLRGIARADSVVWDAHKLMMMPALVTAVLFRRQADAYAAFAQQAPYLFGADAGLDLGQRTLECTKRAMAVELWTALRVHGEAWFGAVVDRLHELAGELAARVSAAPDFELALAPESNIVVYALRDTDNRALRDLVARDGRFYVVGTEIRGRYWLRSTVMNPLIEPHDLDALLAHLRQLGARCRA